MNTSKFIDTKSKNQTKIKHKSESKYYCKICRYGSNTRTNYYRHLKTVRHTTNYAIYHPSSNKSHKQKTPDMEEMISNKEAEELEEQAKELVKKQLELHRVEELKRIKKEGEEILLNVIKDIEPYNLFL